MKKLEIVLPIIAIVGFLIHMLNWPFGEIIVIFSLLVLSLLYLFFSFLICSSVPFRKMFKKEYYKEVSVLRVIGSIGVGMGVSLVILGIMFKVFNWPFADQNLIIGGGLLAIIILISLVRFMTSNNEFYITTLYRMGIYGFLGLMFLFIPKYTFFEIKYRDYPDYIKAVKNLDSNPEDPVLQEKRREAYNKMLEDS